jgi:uncharacterized protein YchJ
MQAVSGAWISKPSSYNYDDCCIDYIVAPEFLKITGKLYRYRYCCMAR